MELEKESGTSGKDRAPEMIYLHWWCCTRPSKKRSALLQGAGNNIRERVSAPSLERQDGRVGVVMNHKVCVRLKNYNQSTAKRERGDDRDDTRYTRDAGSRIKKKNMFWLFLAFILHIYATTPLCQ